MSALCVLADETIFLGNTVHNVERHSVPLWMSDDKGRTWKVAYEFPAGSIKHIHGVYSDPFGSSLLIPTGNFAGECFLLEYDPSSGEMKRHGNDSQPQQERHSLYYYMHRDLLNVADNRLRNGSSSGRQAFQVRFTADVQNIAREKHIIHSGDRR